MNIIFIYKSLYRIIKNITKPQVISDMIFPINKIKSCLIIA